MGGEPSPRDRQKNQPLPLPLIPAHAGIQDPRVQPPSHPLPPPPRANALPPDTLTPCTATTTLQPPRVSPPEGRPGFASPRVKSVLYLQRANSPTKRIARRIPAATPDAEINSAPRPFALTAS